MFLLEARLNKAVVVRRPRTRGVAAGVLSRFMSWLIPSKR